MRRSRLAPIDRRAATWGVVAVVLAVALAVLGSGNLRWFDAALVGYLFGTFFAIFGVVYRYLVWLRRPPTARLSRRGWEAFRRPGRRGRNLAALPGLVVSNLLLQSFVRRRSRARWAAHQLVFWGCLLAAAVTFPLVFGLLHFESVGQNGREYRTYVGGLGTMTFDSRSLIGWVTFHLLDIAAVLVLAGVFLFLGRRLRDPGALAVERSNDFLALAGLFAVSVTGLALTASNLWMEGRFYVFLNTVHALTVILGLMYLPFGKLFHIFQRPGNLGVAYYKREGETGPQQACCRCGAPFASALQMGDLKDVLPQVGFDYALPEGGNYQDHCPLCRRRLVTLAQSRRVGGFG
ncbi:MAG TPA: MFS transporter [Acidimicrobiia bacterium]|nr:MFS transporter [Acidimicrobiia bacterium]